MNQSILIVHPPEAKACEPPGGPARLAGSLRRHGVFCRIWDANLEGQIWLMEEARRGEEAASDTWTRRAANGYRKNIASIRSREVYRNPDRYRRVVTDLNRLLAVAGRPHGVRLSLADYEDERLSPVRSADLIEAAAEPHANPFYPWFSGRLRDILTETPVRNVGFSLNYLSQALTAFAMIGFLRQSFAGLRIIVGGGLVTSWMRQPDWRNPFKGLVDRLLAGPGEAPLLSLLGKKHDGGLDRPDFEGFSLNDYLSPGIVLPYSASSGCWWRRCSFCPEQAENNPYRPLPPARVAADLRILNADMNPALIHLLDNAMSPALLDALIQQPPGSPWYGFARFTPHLADPDFCMRIRDAGCIMLKLGLESGDQMVLDALRKGIELKTVSAALKNLRASGVATYVYLLFGTPAETPEAARRTLDFTVEHAEEIDFLNLALFNLPACGAETEGFDTGEFYAGDLSLYRPFSHLRGWNRERVRHFLEKEFRKHQAIAPIIRHDPPWFTSNHAPFFA